MKKPARRATNRRASTGGAKSGPKPKPRAPDVVRDDSDRFEPWLSEFDLHLFGEGTHEHLYEKMGAQLTVHQRVAGVNFAVWAPNALRVSLIGDFNRWDSGAHPMHRRGPTGVWELFVPGLGHGALYKFDILTRHEGRSTVKADPYGFAMELRPNTASMVFDLNRYTWQDEAWMATRADRQRPDRPLAIYEVHPGSWKRRGGAPPDWLSWRELADDLVPYVKRMGFTHIELLPVTEHPFDGSWGYQTVGYFAPTSRFGSPDDFRHFVDSAHQAGIGVILDWVPAHFPKDAHGLGFFDGTHLYEHADPRKGEHRDWGTLVFNLSRPQVSGLLLASALHWLDRFHVDGLRVDAVASMLYLDYGRKDGEWIPNQYGGREDLEAVAFLKELNELAHGQVPGVISAAEESTAWPGVSRPTYLGGLGFGFKWNMGWMHDTLSYFQQDPIHRRYHHHELTFSLLYAFSENFVLPLSHDEVVHGKGSLIAKMPGDDWQKAANLRALYGYMWAHPGKKLLFMGQEFAQEAEWSHEHSLDWHLLEQPRHAGIQSLVRDLNHAYRDEAALWQLDNDPDGFNWIEANDADNSVLAFARWSANGERVLCCVCNLTPVPRESYRLGLPRPGRWRELINTDAGGYGGSNVGNLGSVETEPVAWHGQQQSAAVTLPPLSTTWFVPERS